MQRDLLIPTSGSSQRLSSLLTSISSQKILPDHIIFLLHSSYKLDRLLEIEQFIHQWLDGIETKVSIHHQYNSDYQSWWWVWADRDYLIRQTHSDYLYMIDDDNIFGPRFFQDCIGEYQKTTWDTDTPIIRSPLIGYRDTEIIQSAGIARFRRRIPKYRYARPGSKKQICAIGANSLLWPTQLFQQIWFDHNFWSTLEDIDFSYRATRRWAKIIVSSSIRIQHMERDKSLLEKKFLSPPDLAYERSKNRVIFAKKNTTPMQKFLYLWCWLREQTGWFIALVILYGGSERWRLIRSIIVGTFAWLRQKKSS